MSWTWFGRVAHDRAEAWQERRRAGVIAGTAPETLALFEHDPVVTTGRRAVEDLQRVSEAGIPIRATNRGGLATWHGPGQLVGYPIVDLNRRGLSVRGAVSAIESGIIRWLEDQGVAAQAEARRGVWVGDAKIASVGIHVQKGVVMHGFALNLTCDLAGFGLFTPCGLEGVRMTRLRDHGCDVTPDRAAAAIAHHVLLALTPPSRSIKRAANPEGV